LTNAKEIIKIRGVAEGKITIEAYQEGDGTLILSISDNGGGISTDVLPKIFDPYFTTKEAGSGIGLYMTQMIIERNHNGSVVAQNIPNGAKFTIILPNKALPLQKELV
jgi:signal transduction histidine kinase